MTALVFLLSVGVTSNIMVIYPAISESKRFILVMKLVIAKNTSVLAYLKNTPFMLRGLTVKVVIALNTLEIIGIIMLLRQVQSS